MAWMIKAGNVKTGTGDSAGTLSIESAPKGLCRWRVRTVHPCLAAADDVWQDVLENLIQQENNNEQ